MAAAPPAPFTRNCAHLRARPEGLLSGGLLKRIGPAPWTHPPGRGPSGPRPRRNLRHGLRRPRVAGPGITGLIMRSGSSESVSCIAARLRGSSIKKPAASPYEIATVAAIR